jgi:hypothetical protein
MQSWNQLVQNAMIGTGKKTPDFNIADEGITEILPLIKNNDNIDNEEKFLQVAALALNYRQAGVQPATGNTAFITPAPDEQKSYCNTQAIQVLNDILFEDNIPLLKMWLLSCSEKNLVVTPEYIPSLFDKALQQKSIASLVAMCCGKRGEWLSAFNSEWNFSMAVTDEELWQTGAAEQRNTLFAKLRREDPAKAREWLQQVWLQEDAGTRVSFLELFQTNLVKGDIPFLESLDTDKSKKVKELATELLKKIPDSSIVLKYAEVLRRSVLLKKEKALLGMISKKTLSFSLPAEFDQSIFKTGIEKLSSSKEITDEHWVIFQLIKNTPLQFWQTHFDATPEQVIQLFQKDAIGKTMIPALVNAIQNFSDADWAVYFMQYSDVFYIDIIPLLPLQQQEFYCNQYFEKFPDSIINFAMESKNEWGMELTKKIFRHTAKNPYQYNRAFYLRNIELIPIQIVGELERCTPPEEVYRSNWSNMSEYISKLIYLKIQTKNPFNL